MTAKEVNEIVFSYSILIALFTSISWYVINYLIQEWKKKKIFFIVNAVILLFYSVYFINGRINHSEFGGALVWEFYLALIFIGHNVILLIASIVISYKLKEKRNISDIDQQKQQYRIGETGL